MTGRDRPLLRVAGGTEDTVVRRQRFERAWDLGGLMDQLDQLYEDCPDISVSHPDR